MNNFFSVEKINDNIIIISYSSVLPTAKENQEFFDYIINWLSKIPIDKKAVWLLDTSKLKFLSAETRIQTGKFISDNQILFDEKLLGAIIFNSSLIVEMITKGVFLVKKPPFPIIFSNSKEESIAKAKEMLSQNMLIS